MTPEIAAFNAAVSSITTTEQWKTMLADNAEHLAKRANADVFLANHALNQMQYALEEEGGHVVDECLLSEVYALAKLAFAAYPDATFDIDVDTFIWSSPWGARCSDADEYIVRFARRASDTEENSVTDDDLENPEHLATTLEAAQALIAIGVPRQTVLDNLDILALCDEANEDLVTDAGVDAAVARREQGIRHDRPLAVNSTYHSKHSEPVCLANVSDEQFEEWLAKEKIDIRKAYVEKTASPRAVLERSRLTQLRAML